jgi:hypothetical protein
VPTSTQQQTSDSVGRLLWTADRKSADSAEVLYQPCQCTITVMSQYQACGVVSVVCIVVVLQLHSFCDDVERD